MDLFDDLPEPVNLTGDTISKESNGEDHEIQYKKRKVDDFRNDSADLSLRGYSAERKGERDEMQDAHVMIDDLTRSRDLEVDCSITRLAYYAVFDGHGGARASQYAAKHLHVNLTSRFPKGDVDTVHRDIKKCFVEVFKKTDEDFLKEASKNKPSWKDGTTAVAIVAINDTLYIANLGDSKAILSRFSKEKKCYVPVALTVEHAPTEYAERMRIQKMGGQVKDGRVMGVLEVARSIGDGQFKTCGVICIPDVRRCTLSQQDRYIIVACDGLWKAFSPEEAISFVDEVLKDETIKGTEFKTVLESRFEAACNKLVNEAVRRGSGDNVTIVIVSVGV